MDADFKSMSRRDLQALCKKHGLRLPANSKTSVLVERLSSLLQSQEKQAMEPVAKGCLKGSGGSGGDGAVSKRVTFNIQEEKRNLDDFEENPRGTKRRASRRLSVVATASAEVVDFTSPARDAAVAVAVGVKTRGSRSLAEAVVWSPVPVTNRRKGAEPARRNAKMKSAVELPVEEDVEVKSLVATRSLRSKLVVAGGDEAAVGGIEPKKVQKRGRSVSSSEVSEVTVALSEEDVGDDARPDKKNTTTKAPTTRSLRNRVVMVEGDQGLSKDSEPVKPRKSRRIAKEPEDEEGSKSGEVEVAEKKSLRKRPQAVLVEECQKVLPSKAVPARRSTRNGSKLVNSLPEFENLENDDVSKSNGKEEGVPLLGDDCVEDVRVAVGRRKSLNRGEKLASKEDDSANVKPDSNGLADDECTDKQKGKLLVIEGPQRRSQLSSKLNVPLENVLKPSSDTSVHTEDVVEKNKLRKQGRKRGTVKEVSNNSDAKTEGEEVSTEAQEKQMPETVEPPRRSTRSSKLNAPQINVSKSSCDTSVDTEEVVEKNKLSKHGRKRGSVKEFSNKSDTKTESGTVPVEAQEKHMPEVVEPPKRAMRSSRQSKPTGELKLPASENSVVEAGETKKNKFGKQTRKKELVEETKDGSDSKVEVATATAEVSNKNLSEIENHPRRTLSSSASNVTDGEITLPITSADECRPTKKNKPGKRSRKNQSVRESAKTLVTVGETTTASEVTEVQKEPKKIALSEKPARRSRRGMQNRETLLHTFIETGENEAVSGNELEIQLNEQYLEAQCVDPSPKKGSSNDDLNVVVPPKFNEKFLNHVEMEDDAGDLPLSKCVEGSDLNEYGPPPPISAATHTGEEIHAVATTANTTSETADNQGSVSSQMKTMPLEAVTPSEKIQSVKDAELLAMDTSNVTETSSYLQTDFVDEVRDCHLLTPSVLSAQIACGITDGARAIKEASADHFNSLCHEVKVTELLAVGASSDTGITSNPQCHFIDEVRDVSAVELSVQLPSVVADVASGVKDVSAEDSDSQSCEANADRLRKDVIPDYLVVDSAELIEGTHVVKQEDEKIVSSTSRAALVHEVFASDILVDQDCEHLHEVFIEDVDNSGLDSSCSNQKNSNYKQTVFKHGDTPSSKYKAASEEVESLDGDATFKKEEIMVSLVVQCSEDSKLPCPSAAASIIEEESVRVQGVGFLGTNAACHTTVTASNDPKEDFGTIDDCCCRENIDLNDLLKSTISPEECLVLDCTTSSRFNESLASPSEDSNVRVTLDRNDNLLTLLTGSLQTLDDANNECHLGKPSDSKFLTEFSPLLSEDACSPLSKLEASKVLVECKEACSLSSKALMGAGVPQPCKLDTHQLNEIHCDGLVDKYLGASSAVRSDRKEAEFQLLGNLAGPTGDSALVGNSKFESGDGYMDVALDDQENSDVCEGDSCNNHEETTGDKENINLKEEDDQENTDVCDEDTCNNHEETMEDKETINLKEEDEFKHKNLDTCFSNTSDIGKEILDIEVNAYSSELSAVKLCNAFNTTEFTNISNPKDGEGLKRTSLDTTFSHSSQYIGGNIYNTEGNANVVVDGLEYPGVYDGKAHDHHEEIIEEAVKSNLKDEDELNITNLDPHSVSCTSSGLKGEIHDVEVKDIDGCEFRVNILCDLSKDMNPSDGSLMENSIVETLGILPEASDGNTDVKNGRHLKDNKSNIKHVLGACGLDSPLSSNGIATSDHCASSDESSDADDYKNTYSQLLSCMAHDLELVVNDDFESDKLGDGDADGRECNNVPEFEFNSKEETAEEGNPNLEAEVDNMNVMENRKFYDVLEHNVSFEEVSTIGNADKSPQNCNEVVGTAPEASSVQEMTAVKNKCSNAPESNCSDARTGDLLPVEQSYSKHLVGVAELFSQEISSLQSEPNTYMVDEEECKGSLAKVHDPQFCHSSLYNFFTEASSSQSHPVELTPLDGIKDHMQPDKDLTISSENNDVLDDHLMKNEVASLSISNATFVSNLELENKHGYGVNTEIREGQLDEKNDEVILEKEISDFSKEHPEIKELVVNDDFKSDKLGDGDADGREFNIVPEFEFNSKEETAEEGNPNLEAEVDNMNVMENRKFYDVLDHSVSTEEVSAIGNTDKSPQNCNAVVGTAPEASYVQEMTAGKNKCSNIPEINCSDARTGDLLPVELSYSKHLVGVAELFSQEISSLQSEPNTYTVDVEDCKGSLAKVHDPQFCHSSLYNFFTEASSSQSHPVELNSLKGIKEHMQPDKDLTISSGNNDVFDDHFMKNEVVSLSINNATFVSNLELENKHGFGVNTESREGQLDEKNDEVILEKEISDFSQEHPEIKGSRPRPDVTVLYQNCLSPVKVENDTTVELSSACKTNTEGSSDLPNDTVYEMGTSRVDSDTFFQNGPNEKPRSALSYMNPMEEETHNGKCEEDTLAAEGSGSLVPKDMTPDHWLNHEVQHPGNVMSSATTLKGGLDHTDFGSYQNQNCYSWTDLKLHDGNHFPSICDDDSVELPNMDDNTPVKQRDSIATLVDDVCEDADGLFSSPIGTSRSEEATEIQEVSPKVADAGFSSHVISTSKKQVSALAVSDGVFNGKSSLCDSIELESMDGNTPVQERGSAATLVDEVCEDTDGSFSSSTDTSTSEEATELQEVAPQVADAGFSSPDISTSKMQVIALAVSGGVYNGKTSSCDSIELDNMDGNTPVQERGSAATLVDDVGKDADGSCSSPIATSKSEQATEVQEVVPQVADAGFSTHVISTSKMQVIGLSVSGGVYNQKNSLCNVATNMSTEELSVVRSSEKKLPNSTVNSVSSRKVPGVCVGQSTCSPIHTEGCLDENRGLSFYLQREFETAVSSEVASGNILDLQSNNVKHMPKDNAIEASAASLNAQLSDSLLCKALSEASDTELCENVDCDLKETLMCGVVDNDNDGCSDESSFGINMFEDCNAANDGDCTSSGHSLNVNFGVLPETDNARDIVHERVNVAEDEILHGMENINASGVINIKCKAIVAGSNNSNSRWDETGVLVKQSENSYMCENNDFDGDLSVAFTANSSKKPPANEGLHKIDLEDYDNANADDTFIVDNYARTVSSEEEKPLSSKCPGPSGMADSEQCVTEAGPIGNVHPIVYEDTVRVNGFEERSGVEYNSSENDEAKRPKDMLISFGSSNEKKTEVTPFVLDDLINDKDDVNGKEATKSVLDVAELDPIFTVSLSNHAQIEGTTEVEVDASPVNTMSEVLVYSEIDDACQETAGQLVPIGDTHMMPESCCIGEEIVGDIPKMVEAVEGAVVSEGCAFEKNEFPEYEKFGDFDELYHVETSDMNCFPQDNEVNPQAPDDSSISSSKSFTVAHSGATEFDLKGRGGVDQMEEISCKLLNFNLSSTMKIRKPVLHRTPLKPVECFKNYSGTNELNDKENTSVIKMDRSARPFVERQSTASAVRRPLHDMQNNSRVSQ